MATGQVIRSFVADRYPETSIDPAPVMLLTCADTIERLTKERDEALKIVRQLTEITHGHP